MNAQTFWAPTVSEAMKQVALELGGSAMIVSTEEAIHPTHPSGRLFCVTAIPGEEDMLDRDDLWHRNLEGRKTRSKTSTGGDSSGAAIPMDPAQIELFASLLNQLQVLQTELLELRSAREDWERTTALCRDLRAEVQALATRMDNRGVLGARQDGGVPEVAHTTDAKEKGLELKTMEPLWERSAPTLALIRGPHGAGKTLTAAKIAAEASAQGKSVALLDCTTTGELEKLGNRIGIPTWNVPAEGNLARVLQACSGLDLVLLELPAEGGDEILSQVDLSEFRMEVHALTVIPANWDEKSLENVLQSIDETDSVALSKVDETKRFEGILAVIKKSGYPVSHVCTGTNFPGDIRSAKAGELNAETRAA
jgi:flagellar biosynthesis GTPase FlhF